MHFSRLHVCCTLVFFLVLNDREGIDSLNLSSEPNHECNSPSVAGTQHEDQSPLLRYREAVQQNPVRPSGCTTTPKSRLALRRHNGKYNLNLSWPFCRRILKKYLQIFLDSANPIVLVSPVQNKTVAYRKLLLQNYSKYITRITVVVRKSRGKLQGKFNFVVAIAKK